MFYIVSILMDIFSLLFFSLSSNHFHVLHEIFVGLSQTAILTSSSSIFLENFAFANIPIIFLFFVFRSFFYVLVYIILAVFCPCPVCVKNIIKIMTYVLWSVIINRIWHKRIHAALSMDINGTSDTRTSHPLARFISSRPKVYRQ